MFFTTRIAYPHIEHPSTQTKHLSLNGTRPRASFFHQYNKLHTLSLDLPTYLPRTSPPQFRKSLSWQPQTRDRPLPYIRTYLNVHTVHTEYVHSSSIYRPQSKRCMYISMPIFSRLSYMHSAVPKYFPISHLLTFTQRVLTVTGDWWQRSRAERDPLTHPSACLP